MATLTQPIAPANTAGETAMIAYTTAVLNYLLQQLAAGDAATLSQSNAALSTLGSKVLADEVAAANLLTTVTAIQSQLAAVAAQVAALPPVPDLQPFKDAINAMLARSNSGLQYLADLGAYTQLGKKIDDELAAMQDQAPLALIP